MTTNRANVPPADVLQHGIVYNPTWVGWTPPYPNTGANAQFSDTDFFNDAFVALWNSGKNSAGNAYRADLQSMGQTGFTLVRLYNWDPTRGWNGTSGNAHLDFLKTASGLGMQVVVPISNYFLSDDTYAWNGAAPGSLTFDSAPVAIQTALNNFLSSVTDPATSKLHAAVHSFSVGNEIDLNTLVGQGTSGPVEPSVRLARILWWFVNLQGQIASKKLGQALVTSPISNADQGDPGVSPSSYWFQAFVNGVVGGTTPLPQGTAPAGPPSTFANTVSGLNQYPASLAWYYNSVNIYQYSGQLAATLGQYDAWQPNSQNALNWPGQQFSVPLLLTEIGFQRATPNSAQNQNAQFQIVTQGIVSTIQNYVTTLYQTQAKNTKLMGYCLYEFNDEPYLNGNFGLYMAEPTNYPDGKLLYQASTGSTPVSYGTFPSVKYPVNQLFPVQNSSGVDLDAAIQQLVFVVSARESWQNCGITLSAGQTATIVCLKGLWTADPKTNGGALYTASGDASITVTQSGYPLQGQNMGALVGRVGTNAPFLIGAGQVSAPSGQVGPLSLVINDDLPGLHGAGLTDNSGFVTVIVTVTSS